MGLPMGPRGYELALPERDSDVRRVVGLHAHQMSVGMRRQSQRARDLAPDLASGRRSRADALRSLNGRRYIPGWFDSMACLSRDSASQFGEERLLVPALLHAAGGRPGTFVELGALDGRTFANTCAPPDMRRARGASPLGICGALRYVRRDAACAVRAGVRSSAASIGPACSSRQTRPTPRGCFAATGVPRRCTRPYATRLAWRCFRREGLQQPGTSRWTPARVAASRQPPGPGPRTSMQCSAALSRT